MGALEDLAEDTDGTRSFRYSRTEVLGESEPTISGWNSQLNAIRIESKCPCAGDVLEDALSASSSLKADE